MNIRSTLTENVQINKFILLKTILKVYKGFNNISSISSGSLLFPFMNRQQEDKITWIYFM